MSKGQKKSVQPAESQKPSEETKQYEANVVSSDTSGQSAQVVTTQVSVEQQPAPSPLEDLKARMLTPETIEKAKVVGLDLQPLLDYATSLEVRFVQIERAFEHVGVALDKIAPLADLAEKYKQAQAAQPQGQAPPQGQGLNLGSLQQLLPLLLGGGGGIDPTIQYLADIGKETIGLGHFVFKEVIKKAIPEAVEGWENARKAAAAKT